MDVNQGSTLLRNGLSRIVEAVQVEHVKADGHADEHNDAGNHVEKALSSLPLKRPSVCRGRCNSGTHRLSPRRSFSFARGRTQKSEIDVSDANQAWNSSWSHIAKAHVGMCAGQPWYYVRSTPSEWSANRKLATRPGSESLILRSCILILVEQVSLCFRTTQQGRRCPAYFPPGRASNLELWSCAISSAMCSAPCGRTSCGLF